MPVREAAVRKLALEEPDFQWELLKGSSDRQVLAAGKLQKPDLDVPLHLGDILLAWRIGLNLN